MTIRCGGMLNSIIMARHAIAAAVNEIVIVGQWCRRKSLPSIPYHFFQPIRIEISRVGKGLESIYLLASLK